MCKLSIIIATYNSAKTIADALKSVCAQTYQNWECIVVDGASTDNTVCIVNDFILMNSQIRCVSKKDNGIYDGFNKGWRMAKGEWIHYLGSDDKLTEDGMERLMKYAEDADLVGGGVYLCRENEVPKPQYTNGIGGCHQGFVIKRSVIEELGGFDEQYRIFADKDLLIRLEQARYKVRNYPIIIAYFYIGGISQNIRSLYSLTKERYRSYQCTGYSKYPLISSAYSYIYAILVFLKHKIIG